MMAEKRWARTIALAPLLLAAVCWSMLAAPASSQCTDDHQGCNFYTSQRVYERSFPTWMYLGMPLVIQSEYDTEVRMVEREDVQTQVRACPCPLSDCDTRVRRSRAAVCVGSTVSPTARS